VGLESAAAEETSRAPGTRFGEATSRGCVAGARSTMDAMPLILNKGVDCAFFNSRDDAWDIDNESFGRASSGSGSMQNLWHYQRTARRG
jgi:hypothetical protein